MTLSWHVSPEWKKFREVCLAAEMGLVFLAFKVKIYTILSNSHQDLKRDIISQLLDITASVDRRHVNCMWNSDQLINSTKHASSIVTTLYPTHGGYEILNRLSTGKDIYNRLKLN
jgi:hypothetical protein